jgi:hypothetical protein
MTAYRQRALACAAMLRVGRCRTCGLRHPMPAGFLLRNVYGWFERLSPGLYRLTGLGEAALQCWAGATAAPETTPNCDADGRDRKVVRTALPFTADGGGKGEQCPA